MLKPIPLKYKLLLSLSLAFVSMSFLLRSIAWFSAPYDWICVGQTLYLAGSFWIGLISIVIGYSLVTAFKIQFPQDKRVWFFRLIYIIGYSSFWHFVARALPFFIWQL